MTNPFPVRTGMGSEPANQDLSLKLNEWLARSGPNGLFRTCGSCNHMARNPNPAHCALYGMTPPVEIILVGCDAHKDEAEPPF